MTRIDNPQQLAQLRVRYAQVEGAIAVAKAAEATAQSIGRQYVEMVQVLSGLSIPPGANLGVDFDTGEITLQTQQQQELEPRQNGVAV